MPTSATQFGGYSKEEFMSSAKVGMLSVDRLAQGNKTTFQWQPEATNYYTPKTGGAGALAAYGPPPIKDRVVSTTPSSGQGATIKQHPTQLKTAVNALMASSHKEPKFEDSLTPKAKAAYLNRLEQTRGAGIVVAGNLLSEAFVEPIQKAKDVVGKLTDKPSVRSQLREQEDVLVQKINDLMEQANKASMNPKTKGYASQLFANAQETEDSLNELKINNMSTLEIIKLGSEHPSMTNITEGLSVGAMQFIALRNMPFMKSLSDAIELKAAKGLASVGLTSEVSGVGAGLLTSKTGTKLARMAAGLAGDIPTTSVLPALNFDYAHRPLSELPKQTLTDLALLVPTALTLHLGGAAIGAASTGLADALTVGVVRASAKIAGMARALRIPLTKNSGQALERAVVEQADNAFGRMLGVMSMEERMALSRFYEMKRMATDGENRLLSLRGPEEVASGMPESRLIAKTGKGAKPEPSLPSSKQLELDAASKLPEIQPAEVEMMTRATKAPKPKTGATRKAIKGVLTDPPPEIEVIHPYQRTLFFRSLLELPFGKGKSKAALDEASKALTTFTEKFYSSLTPLKGLQRTWAAVKQYPKMVSNETREAMTELKSFFVNNFKDRAAVDEFARFRIIRMMEDRARQGHTNPGAAKFGIPNNPTMEWLAAERARMSTPEMQAINAQFNEIYSKYTIDNYKGRIPDEVLAEWKTKYPDHMTFFYEKYMVENDGTPNKSYNFSARDYLTGIRGGEGLEISTNLYDSTVKSVQRAISDKYTDQVATTLRQEMGLQPLKMFENANGRRNYQAIVDGKLYQFDAQDLEAGIVKGLEGQRVLYSKVDGQGFLVPKELAAAVKHEMADLPESLNVLFKFTHLWQDLTTTWDVVFAGINNPIKDFEFAAINTDYSLKKFFSSYVSGARDLFASVLYKDKVLNMRMAKDGIYALDERVMTKIQGKVQDAMNWAANKVGTKGWKEFVEAFDEFGGDQGGWFTQRSNVLTSEEGMLSAIKRMATGEKFEYSIQSVDPKFIPNKYVRSAVQLKNGIVAVRFDSVRNLGGFMEKLPRAAEFRLKLQEGLKIASKEDAGIAAGAAASDITLDFAERGSSAMVRLVKGLFPYYYTSWRGNAKMIKAALGKGKGPMAAAIVARRIATASILPSIVLGMLNKKLGISDRVDPSVREGYWIIPTLKTWVDEYGNENPVIFTIRKGEMSQKITPVIDALMEAMLTENPAPFNRLGVDEMLDTMISKISPIFRLPLEIAANKSFFRSEYINPSYMMQLVPEMRYYKGTTFMGKILGDTLGVGGNQGDYILNSMAPALFKDLKYMTRPDRSMPVGLNVASALKILQIPSAFYGDKDLDKKRKEILESIKLTQRQVNPTQEEREAATQKLWQMIFDIDDMVAFRQEERMKYPLVGTPIAPEAPAPAFNREKVKAFFLATPEERKILYPKMSPEDIAEIKRITLSRKAK